MVIMAGLSTRRSGPPLESRTERGVPVLAFRVLDRDRRSVDRAGATHWASAIRRASARR